MCVCGGGGVGACMWLEEYAYIYELSLPNIHTQR